MPREQISDLALSKLDHITFYEGVILNSNVALQILDVRLKTLNLSFCVMYSDKLFAAFFTLAVDCQNTIYGN